MDPIEELASHLRGAWQPGDGPTQSLFNPATQEAIAVVRPARELANALAFARDVGGASLRALTRKQRGELLQSAAKVLHEHREELIELAVRNGGNTRSDAKFDIDGATGVLSAYAELAGTLGDSPWLVDGEAVSLTRSGKVKVQHVLVPRHGVAVHINAFNFPAWGMIGKAAVAWLAGMPVLSKPATSTCWVAHRIAAILLEGKLLPEGALQLLVGPVGDLLDHLGPQDVVAFTGSADTGAKIRGHANVLRHGVRINVEADSLNAVIIGSDVSPGTELFDLVVRDCVTEITQKAGQKCTATRRILVPEHLLEAVRIALVERLDDIAARTGNPADPQVRMGPLATDQQLHDGRNGVHVLTADARVVRGDTGRTVFMGAADAKGWFLEPILLEATSAAALEPRAAFHRREVFGPVATLLPYDGSFARAAQIVAAGGGSLVSTVYSDDRDISSRATLELGAFLGRLVIAGEKIAAASFSPGLVFPQAAHGGPGRAGSGEELGGVRALALYSQRTAVQAGAAQLAKFSETHAG